MQGDLEAPEWVDQHIVGFNDLLEEISFSRWMSASRKVAVPGPTAGPGSCTRLSTQTDCG